MELKAEVLHYLDRSIDVDVGFVVGFVLQSWQVRVMRVEW